MTPDDYIEYPHTKPTSEWKQGYAAGYAAAREDAATVAEGFAGNYIASDQLVGHAIAIAIRALSPKGDRRGRRARK